MRVVNDKDEKVGNEVNFINMLSNAAFCAFGVATAIFSPLSMISAHLKQVEPWSKISCLIGAMFAITLLDINMPVLDGFGVLEKLAPDMRTFPIIILTNFADQANRDRGAALKVDDYFVKKDMTIKSLMEMVERLVKSKA
jgi:CheY-like chemotaxis protein